MNIQKEFANVFKNKDNERSRVHFQEESGGIKIYDLVEVTNLTDDLSSFNKVIGYEEDKIEE